MKPTIFLDRDGVINYDSPNYILSWKDFKFIPGSLQAIAKFTKAGFRIIIITNQSAVGRGMISATELYTIFYNMTRAIIAEDGKIDDIFVCPHTPEDKCECRKPLPGMIIEAVKKYKINLDHSYMIGDKPKDIICGKLGGCDYTILINDNIQNCIGYPDIMLPNLLTAADWIIKKEGYKI